MQKVSQQRTMAFARLIDFLCMIFLCKMTASKTRPAKYEDLVVLQVLMAKHYSAAAIHLEIYAVYEQNLRIKGELYKKLHSIGYVHLNMNKRMGIMNIVLCSHSFLNNKHACLFGHF